MVAGLKPRALTRKVGVKEISTMNQVTNTQLIRVQSRMLRLFSSARRLPFASSARGAGRCARGGSGRTWRQINQAISRPGSNETMKA